MSPENHNAIDTTNEDDFIINEQDTHLNNYDQWQMCKNGTSNQVINNDVGVPNNLYHASYSLTTLLNSGSSHPLTNGHAAELNSGVSLRGGSKTAGLRIEDVERISKGVVKVELGGKRKEIQEGNNTPGGDDVYVEEKTSARKSPVCQI